MTFSELVAFKNQLDLLSSKPANVQVDQEIRNILHAVETPGQNIDSHLQALKICHRTILENLRNFEQELDTLKQQVDLAIAEQGKFWFEQTDKVYQQRLSTELSQTILERRLSLTDEERTLFHSRISLYTSWQRPGLIVRPGRETLINNMTDSDPLYLVDRRSDLLEPVLNGFNPVYQNKLCTYVVNEDDPEILHALPDAQFGIILVYNFFNYRPLPVIEKFLMQIYKKLQPGGCVIMTFNNCDHWQAVHLVELNYCSYTPGHMMRKLVGQIGYEWLHTIAINHANTWVELRKPGVMISSKGGQVTAIPTTKPEAIKMHQLRSLAREFAMASPAEILLLDAEQLIQLIIQSGKENLL